MPIPMPMPLNVRLRLTSARAHSRDPYTYPAVNPPLIRRESYRTLPPSRARPNFPA